MCGVRGQVGQEQLPRWGFELSPSSLSAGSGSRLQARKSKKADTTGLPSPRTRERPVLQNFQKLRPEGVAAFCLIAANREDWYKETEQETEATVPSSSSVMRTGEEGQMQGDRI